MKPGTTRKQPLHATRQPNSASDPERVKMVVDLMSVPSELSLNVVRALLLLRERHQTMAEISDALHITRAATTGLMDRLEECGLATRRTDPIDRRKCYAVPTEHGEQITRQISVAA